MPERPPKAWWDRCVADVSARGGAIDPAAVCGAVWKKKSPAERRAIVALEEGGRGMAKKKKKGKKKHHKHAGAKKSHAKKSHGKKHHAKKHHKKGHKGARRCGSCGHAHKGVCTHMVGSSVCPCNRLH